MTEKRRDKKNRILHLGESQRKDGRYAYKYINPMGKVKFAYSWKLVPTDKVPHGKHDDISLREKEQAIQSSVGGGMDITGRKITVCELYNRQIKYKYNVRYNTLQGQLRLKKLLEEDKIGSYPIARVKQSDAKEWVLRMKQKGMSYKTISNDKRSLKAIFYEAIQDDYIRKNPFAFQLNTVIKDDTRAKKPLTSEQVANLLSFINSDKIYKRYYDEFVILLGTGLRISELCGLTDDSIDFENKIIHVNHQLLRNAKIGYYIEKPKTQSGIRKIPMSKEVCAAFKRVLEKRTATNNLCPEKWRDFMFLNCKGYPKTANSYDNTFRRITQKYNKHYNKEMPITVTPHILRHTFCTNLANAGMNPKALQYIMGHSNITMTLDYYAHASFASVKMEVERFMP